MIAIAVALSACNLVPGARASLSPQELALQQLAANQALWLQKAPNDYVLTLERQCFCPSARYEITVRDGVVGMVTKDGVAVGPAEVQGLPKTVPELFALVAALPAGAAADVSYDPDLGFPTNISVDSVPNAVDDEYSILVHSLKPG